MKIVGHRGATDLLAENTLVSLKQAEKLGLDAIEFDIRKTSDNKAVALHDRNLFFTSGVNKMVDELTLAQLQKIGTKSGQPIPTFDEVVANITKTPLIFDIKEIGLAKPIVKTMSRPEYKNRQWYITSRVHSEAIEIKRQIPSAKIFLTARLQHPIHIVRAAQEAGAYGITINIWMMNLISYWLAKRAGLKVMTYVYKPRFILHNPFIVRMIRFFYPEIIICSDRADRLLGKI